MLVSKIRIKMTKLLSSFGLARVSRKGARSRQTAEKSNVRSTIMYLITD